MKIVLIRHGKPQLSKLQPIKARNMPDWIDAYNQADIDYNTVPTESALNEAKQCNFIITSQLKRATHSAKILQHPTPHLSDALFQEFDLPYRHISFIKLPPEIWAAIFRITWFLGFSLNAESYYEAKLRASSAADNLIKYAKQHGSVLLVGHGFMNKYIAKELTKRGWNNTKKANHSHWGYGVFEK